MEGGGGHHVDRWVTINESALLDVLVCPFLPMRLISARGHPTLRERDIEQNKRRALMTVLEEPLVRTRTMRRALLWKRH